MIKKFQEISNTVIAEFLARWMLGILFLMAGYWKVFVLTPAKHAENFFIKGFEVHWIPEWLLWALGLSIPVLELAAGLALLAGLWRKLTLTSVGLLLLLTTYGHALQQPLFDIDGHTFTRFVLVIFLLMLPSSTVFLTVDSWISSRKS
ncbi:MauE/DoxX family redox-associated membrane protein [Kordiimonas laminariae]|uniref:MauE/DoxX family redox-associated membrane protein n=1 Tax=Kordiimonas laminariae TaxID=2917717 RepID=UPI001FF5BA8D|nr:MauE/DoxX family redox-associated membrane protein [Kordiimonas laminariae]MCK0069062.1 DoxX family membrane protein [Kordiimonas laminariae]